MHAYLRGESGEDIVESFPSLTLEQVFGALAYYLANRERVDAHLRRNMAEFETLRQQSRKQRPALYAKLEAARQDATAHRE